LITIPKQELVSVEELSVDGENPNRMTPKQLERLSSSVEKYGFIVPIITNKDLLIADGEQRLTVAQKLGMKQVSVIRLPVEDVDRRLLRQVLNKLRGEHELVADAMEFERIIQAGHEDDLKHLLDLSDSQLERYLAEIHEPKPEDYQIPEIDKIETSIQRGDTYGLGKHRLMCGDATNREDVLSLMNGEKADMVFTDPPYGIDYVPEKRPIGGRARSAKPLGGIIGDKTSEINHYEWLQFLPKFCHGAFYICSDYRPRMFTLIWEWIEKTVQRDPTLIVWAKNNFAIGRRDYHRKHECIFYSWFGDKFWSGSRSETDLWEFKREPVNEYLHPTQKPVDLVGYAIINSCPKNGLVSDWFGGSGSTLIAYQQTGRSCYMMEIDRRYCQVIINRWESYTGQKAIKVN